VSASVRVSATRLSDAERAAVDAARPMTSPRDRDDAHERAEALDAALNPGCHASAEYLAGAWYVVTLDAGEGYNFAYAAADVDAADVLRSDWDYSEWRTRVKPSEDFDVAVDWYLQTEGCMLCTAGSCQPVLSDEARVTLDAVRRVEVRR
jgi:hypothetical protein